MSSWMTVDNTWSLPNQVEIGSGPRGFGKCCILVKRPVTKITHDCFDIVDRPLPQHLEDGDVLVQNIMFSMDPTHSIWMREIKQYSPCVAIGNIMRCSSVARVIKTSDEERLPVGSYVATIIPFAGLAEYLELKFEECNRTALDVPLTWYLGPLFIGMGHTAWIGNKICDIKPGDVYVVSGAAGAVGSTAGQLAKLAGAKVIGIAGGKTKCEMLVNELGFDGVVDYKQYKVDEELDRLCPNGIDCYFENVGGEILDLVLARMNCFGRIAFCGAISQYDGGLDDNNSFGPKQWKMIFMKRLKIQGFLCRDHISSKNESSKEIICAIKEERLKFKYDIREAPIEKYVDTLNLLFTGGNTGKLIMKIAN